ALATLLQALLAVGLVWSGSFLELLNYTAVGLAALAGLTIASVFPLRRRAGLAHPYKLPLYPLPPVIFLLLAAWTVGYTVYEEVYLNGTMPGPAVLSLITLLIGIPLSRMIADHPQ